MFKAFLTLLFFFIGSGGVLAQSFSDTKDESEATLAKYINASAVCAKMTDADALYERGMLLISDANDDAYTAAADCFTSAAMKNHTPSQFELGKLYEKGNGVTQSNIFAYKWYQTAVLLGNQNAVPYRNKLEARMSLDEISMANPMIQNTLTLIDLFTQKHQAEIDSYEQQVAKQYKDFGVDIAQYDVKEEQKETFSNPLIEALIRDQRTKEMLQKTERKENEQKENNKKASKKSRRLWAKEEQEAPQ